jgi:hypothetical protein
VLLGDFNPVIFQPSWFSSERLLTVEEAQIAAVEIVHPDVTVFQLPWIGVNVTRERAQFNCLAEPYFERVVGLVSNAFDLLRHTPIRMMGLNNDAHVRASSLDKWHKLGDDLAPKEFWKEFFSTPGMQSLTIRQPINEETRKGRTEVTIEPSARIQPGVYIRINDHFDFTGQNKLMTASDMNTSLKEHWPKSVAFAGEIFAKVAAQL